MPKKILFLLALVLVISQAKAANMDVKWQYDIGTKDKSIYVDDLDSDGIKELIIASDNNIYVFESDGTLRWESTVRNLVSICISDLEWDDKKEIVASSGIGIENIARGNVWIFNNDGKLRLVFPSGRVKSNKILRGIKAIDMDGNGYKEIVGGAGYGVATLADNYNKFLWYTYLNRSITEISTEFKGWLLANSYTELFLIGFDGSVDWNYSILGGINRVYLADFYPAGGEEIFVTSSRDSVHVLDRDGALEVEVNITQGEVNAIPINLDDDDYDEILLASDKRAYALDVNKDVIWEYNISEKILGFRLRDIDRDGDDSILLFTKRYIYGIGIDAKFEYRYDPGLAHSIDSIAVDDFEGDDKDEFIINSGEKVYVFNINWTRIDMEKADSYYREAYDYLMLGVYGNASSYLGKAREIYLKFGDNENLLKCMVLAAKITAGIKEGKKADAEDYYKKAEYYYNISLYWNATLYLGDATRLYKELKDSEGIIKCSLLSKRIEDAKEGNETSTVGNETSTVGNETSTVGNETSTTSLHTIFTSLTTSIPVSSIPLETTLSATTVPSSTDNQAGDDFARKVPTLLAILIVVLAIIVIRKKRMTKIK